MTDELKQDALVDVRGLARRLGYSQPSIRRLVAAGKLPHFRACAGGPLRFEVSDVLAALKAPRNGQSANVSAGAGK